MSETKSTSGGIGFCGLLTIAFIVLKLTHYIDWSWLLVLAPIWGGIAIALIVVIACAAFAGVCLLLAKILGQE